MDWLDELSTGVRRSHHPHVMNCQWNANCPSLCKTSKFPQSVLPGRAGLGWAGGGHAAPSHTAAVWAGPGVDILTIIIITMLQAAIISTILDYRFGAFDCNGIRLRMITWIWHHTLRIIFEKASGYMRGFRQKAKGRMNVWPWFAVCIARPGDQDQGWALGTRPPPAAANQRPACTIQPDSTAAPDSAALLTGLLFAKTRRLQNIFATHHTTYSTNDWRGEVIVGRRDTWFPDCFSYWFTGSWHFYCILYILIVLPSNCTPNIYVSMYVDIWRYS